MSSMNFFHRSAQKEPSHHVSADSPVRSSSRYLNRSQRLRGSPSSERQFVSSLRNQLYVSEKRTKDLEDRLGSLRNQNLALENKLSESRETLRLTRADLDNAEREIKSLVFRLEYLENEKTSLKKDHGQLKDYSMRIEGKLFSKNSGKKSEQMPQERANAHLRLKGAEAFKENIRTENYAVEHMNIGRDFSMERKIIELEQINENYVQEIRILKQSMEKNRKREENRVPSPLSEGSGRKEFGRSSKEREARNFGRNSELERELEKLMITIEELKLVRESNTEELTRQEIKIQGLEKENKLIKGRLKEMEKEKSSLYELVDQNNEKLRLANEEVSKLTSQLNDASIKFFSEKNSLHENIKHIERDRVDFKHHLEMDALKMKEKENVIENLKKIVEDQREEIATLKSMERENTNLKKERQALQEKIVDNEKNSDYIKNEMQKMRSLKSNLRQKIESIMKSKAETSFSKKRELNREDIDEETDLLLGEFEKIVIERNKLREAVNEAVNKCAALMMKEKEIFKEVEKKERQIENLSNSRNLLQKTLADQNLQLKNTNAHMKEEQIELRNDMRLLRDENESLKSIVRRLEKKLQEMVIVKKGEKYK